MAHLKAEGRLIQKASIKHSYPFCWRSDTPLIYRAIDSWFVNVTAIKDRLLANNDKTYWVPSFVKEAQNGYIYRRLGKKGFKFRK